MKHMNRFGRLFSTCLLATAALLVGASPAWAIQISPEIPPQMSNFAVLAKDAVTCTGGTITGDVGTFSAAPVGSVTQTNCSIVGDIHVGDAVAQQTFNGFLSAYAALAPQPGDVCPIITGTLAGQILAPGVYCVSAEAKTGVLTLNGPSNGTWIFKVAPGAFTGTNFSVVMAGGGQACNVTWWVDAATTMTDSHLKGTILSGAATTLTRGTLIGRDFARADATITGTTIVGCTAGSPGPGPGPDPRACSDKVTGGGYITVNGKKANFGVTAGIKKGKPRGHLTYIDHGTGMKVKGTGVTAYVVVNATTRHIEGTAKVNGKRGFTYVVDVTDDGKSGKTDTFKITLSNGYSASGKLAGGNIQLHKRHCDKNGKNDDDDDDGGGNGGGGNDDDDDDDDDD